MSDLADFLRDCFLSDFTLQLMRITFWGLLLGIVFSFPASLIIALIETVTEKPEKAKKGVKG